MRYLRLAAVCLSAVCVAEPALALQIVADFVSGYVSADDGVTQTPLTETLVVGPNGSQEVTASGGFLETTGVPGDVRSLSSATANGLAFAAPGLVRARVFTEATNVSFVPQVPPPPGVHAEAQAGFQARFRELVAVTHPTLPAGSTVTYRVTLDIDGGSSSPVFPNGQFLLQWFAGEPGGTYVGATYSFPNGLFTSVPGDLSSLSQAIDVTTTVGAFIDVSVQLSVAGFSSTAGGHQETSIDVSNTIHLFLDPVTEGLGFTSESTHDYRTSAVPEPSLALLVTGAAAALHPARRRARR
jgi:hypothetical protein